MEGKCSTLQTGRRPTTGQFDYELCYAWTHPLKNQIRLLVVCKNLNWSGYGQNFDKLYHPTFLLLSENTGTYTDTQSSNQSSVSSKTHYRTFRRVLKFEGHHYPCYFIDCRVARGSQSSHFTAGSLWQLQIVNSRAKCCPHCSLLLTSHSNVNWNKKNKYLKTYHFP